MMTLLRKLREKAVIGVVGGSDFVKVSEQLTLDNVPGAFYLPQCDFIVED